MSVQNRSFLPPPKSLKTKSLKWNLNHHFNLLLLSLHHPLHPTEIHPTRPEADTVVVPMTVKMMQEGKNQPRDIVKSMTPLVTAPEVDQGLERDGGPTHPVQVVPQMEVDIVTIEVIQRVTTVITAVGRGGVRKDGHQVQTLILGPLRDIPLGINTPLLTTVAVVLEVEVAQEEAGVEAEGGLVVVAGVGVRGEVAA